MRSNSIENRNNNKESKMKNTQVNDKLARKYGWICGPRMRKAYKRDKARGERHNAKALLRSGIEPASGDGRYVGWTI